MQRASSAAAFVYAKEHLPQLFNFGEFNRVRSIALRDLGITMNAFIFMLMIFSKIKIQKQKYLISSVKLISTNKQIRMQHSFMNTGTETTGLSLLPMMDLLTVHLTLSSLVQFHLQFQKAFL